MPDKQLSVQIEGWQAAVQKTAASAKVELKPIEAVDGLELVELSFKSWPGFKDSPELFKRGETHPAVRKLSFNNVVFKTDLFGVFPISPMWRSWNLSTARC